MPTPEEREREFFRQFGVPERPVSPTVTPTPSAPPRSPAGFRFPSIPTLPGSARVRETIEAAPFPLRLAAELALPTAGALGGVFTGPFAPLAVPAFAAAGEAVAQATGISPQSRLALGTAALAPAAAQLPVRALVRGGQAVLKLVPSVRRAQRAVEAEQAVAAVQRVPSTLLPPSRAAALWNQVRQFPHTVLPQDVFPRVQSAVRNLLDEARAIGGAASEEGRELLGILARTRQILFPRTKPTAPSGLVGPAGQPLPPSQPGRQPLEIGFERIDQARRVMGELTRAGRGRARGAAKRLFGSFMDDLETLAARPGLQGQAAETLTEAVRASSREFAATRVGEIFQAAERVLPQAGGAARIDIGHILTQLNRLTDPASKSFDRRFVKGLGTQLEPLKRFLAEQDKLVLSLGAGELVVAQQVAGMGRRAVRALGLPPGLQRMGGLAAVQAVPQLTRLLLSQPGREALEFVLSKQRGVLTSNALAIAAELAARGSVALGEPFLRREALPEAIEPFGDLPQALF